MANLSNPSSRRLYSGQKYQHRVLISGSNVATGADGRAICRFWGRAVTPAGQVRNIPCVVIGRNLDRIRHLIADGATIAATGVYEMASPDPGKARPFHLIWASEATSEHPIANKQAFPRQAA